MIRKTTFLLVLGSLAFAPPAQAQWAAMNAIQLDVNMGGFRDQVLNEPTGEPRPSRQGAAPRPASTNPALLRFIPNAAARKRNIANFVAKTRAQSPENADQMAQLFASTDVFEAMAQGIAPMGLRIDNVGDTYAVYAINAWEASRGITGTSTSRVQAQAVKAQMSRALLATPSFIQAKPEQKQELAEAMLIQAALISASAGAAAGNPAQMRDLGIAVRQGAKAMGLDLDAMELGETGFVGVE